MELSKVDEDLLEFLALSEPWSMVCGEFCRRYGAVDKLVARLATFYHADYITIAPDPGAPPPSAKAMLADAAAHGFYDEIVISEGPSWTITATDKGFAAVQNRLRAVVNRALGGKRAGRRCCSTGARRPDV